MTPRATKLIIALLCVSVVLQLTTLSMGIWIGWNPANDGSSLGNGKQMHLPAFISDDQKQKLFEKFRVAWNSQEPEKVWDLFDPLTKLQLNKEDTTASISQYQQTFSKIYSGSFSHFEYAATKNQRDWYKLFYASKFNLKNGTTKSGFIEIRIFVKDGSFGIHGFNIQT